MTTLNHIATIWSPIFGICASIYGNFMFNPSVNRCLDNDLYTANSTKVFLFVAINSPLILWTLFYHGSLKRFYLFLRFGKTSDDDNHLSKAWDLFFDRWMVRATAEVSIASI